MISKSQLKYNDFKIHKIFFKEKDYFNKTTINSFEMCDKYFCSQLLTPYEARERFFQHKINVMVFNLH